MTGQSDSPDEINWERVARTEAHPLRLSILDLLAMDGGRTLSPKETAYELQVPLSRVNHHITTLCRSGLIHLVHQHEIGGSIEHFYCLPGHPAEDLFERLKEWRESYRRR